MAQQVPAGLCRHEISDVIIGATVNCGQDLASVLEKAISRRMASGNAERAFQDECQAGAEASAVLP
jgi:hypothetical protein